MVSFPPCKINLGLNVTGKRSDGFHDISTCFYPVPWTDVLEIVPADNFSFSTGGVKIPGSSADNLCVRAYSLLKKDFELKPVAIYLLKIVPVGAGLGGGSADGVFTLKILNDLFRLDLPSAKFRDYAAQLGSDCSFFIDNKPMIGTGKGEILSEVAFSLNGRYLVIVKPEVHISTSEAFAGITPREPDTDLKTVLEREPITKWRDLVTNDFEHQLFQRFPIIEAIKQKLYAYGAVFASMSGSGSAVFGIFDQEIDLRKEFPNEVYWSGFLA
jgi:4-diphosphocytidyl-2-C-methyl-D-erythritol kinase